MKKEKTKISVNTSSGAEKVERIEKKVKTNPKTQKAEMPVEAQIAPQGETESINAAQAAAKQESLAAKKRVEAALEKKKAQEARKADKKAKAAKASASRKKKAAAKKAEREKRAEERAAKRRAQVEARKAAREEKARRRANAKAKKRDADYKKKKQRANQKSERREKGRNNYGGWIAAVTSLGVVTLALATAVTVESIDMNDTRRRTMDGYNATTYELTGIMENVEKDLDRVRVSNSSAQQSRILTDLLVQARLAELDLEKLPIPAEADRNLTTFVNRTAATCERMLAKLRNGESLSEKDFERLENLYKIHHAMREEVLSFTSQMTEKDMARFIKKGTGNVKDALERIEKSTLEENTDVLTKAPRKPADEEGKTTAHIEAAKAEELCLQYFTGYDIAEFQCIGETVGRGYTAYNVQGYDGRGNQLFAEVSQADGKLLRFDYYEDCSAENLDIDDAEEVAEEFLEKLGYEDMEAVRLRSNGSNADFTFVYEMDDVAYYPDEIRVKVCRTRGVVSGYDATKYLRNHKERGEIKVNISAEQAREKLREGLEVQSTKLTVVNTARGERVAYETLCAYGEERYLIFVDGLTGEEISIVNVNDIS